jgi:hypothetical protein
MGEEGLFDCGNLDEGVIPTVSGTADRGHG